VKGATLASNGDAASTKALARAAYAGHRVDVMFHRGISFSTGVNEALGPTSVQWTSITGYIVAMDRYHIGIVETPLRNNPPSVLFVHKSAQVISIAGSPSFDREDEETRDAISKIGAPFWRYCATRYLGHKEMEKE
jgi:hypothetical protein